jgi:hypothetical protein
MDGEEILHCGVPLQEALLLVRRVAYPHYELGRFKRLITLKVEAVCSSVTSLLPTVKRYEVPGDICH